MSWRDGWDGPREPLDIPCVCEGCGRSWKEEAESASCLEEEPPECPECGSEDVTVDPEGRFS
ncbi:MAG: hypothetical protein CMH55_07705 [Myxococcales bacterium]|nr:hypothetical protein [Myxococcales bacterium]|tara:strand:- start:889 stop:1074 length:186 start_codon:yes stop_codon:yes gene_type:complete